MVKRSRPVPRSVGPGRNCCLIPIFNIQRNTIHKSGEFNPFRERDVQVIFRPPQYFGHLFLKKGASQYPRRSRNELLGLHVFPNAEPKPFYAELDTITELGLNTRLITTLQRLTGAASRRSARTGQIRRIGCTRG